MQDNMNGGQALVMLLVMLLVLGLLVVIYFVPAIIAKSRHAANTGTIFFLNLFFGWTGLGWLAVLVMAMLCQTKAQRAFYESQRSHGGHPPPPQYGPPAGRVMPPPPQFPPNTR